MPRTPEEFNDYVAVMRLMQVRDAGHLTAAMKTIGYPALIVGLLLDLIVNTVVATLIFLRAAP